MEETLTCWNSDPPDRTAKVEEIDHFVARGMRRVYGRGDYFGPHHSFNMDIWMDRNQRLLMRCWSRCIDFDWRSFEIKGLNKSDIPKPDKTIGLQDFWLPKAVRNAYENWIMEEF